RPVAIEREQNIFGYRFCLGKNDLRFFASLRMTTAISAQTSIPERSTQARMAPPSPIADKAFEWLTLLMVLVVVVLVILIGWQLWNGSSLAIRKFGFHFLTTSTWDPVAE